MNKKKDTIKIKNIYLNLTKLDQIYLKFMLKITKKLQLKYHHF